VTDLAITIPTPEGSARYVMGPPRAVVPPAQPFTSRRVFAAPHVVVDAAAEYTPGVTPPVDWDATIAYRRYLWRLGIGVAEAMDTSERGPQGLSWAQVKELISRSVAAASEAGGAVMCGAGTDQLTESHPSLRDITAAYAEQVAYVQSEGSKVVLRASHALARAATTADDYAQVIGDVVADAHEPVVIHWIGEVFDPELRGYFGHTDLDDALKAVVTLAEAHRDKIAGYKFSLLDVEREVRFRRELPEGMLVYTGDDHDYPQMLAGDAEGHSHGLLGVFDPLAPIASEAFGQLDDGDVDGFRSTLEATLPLARRMFENPAGDYKTGVVFTAFLAGHQDHFRMVSGREGKRSLAHLVDLFVHGDRLGLWPDPELAVRRMQSVLALGGAA
jgi:hypothetical protein